MRWISILRENLNNLDELCRSCQKNAQHSIVKPKFIHWSFDWSFVKWSIGIMFLGHLHIFSGCNWHKKWNSYASANYAICNKQRCAIKLYTFYAKIFHTTDVFICDNAFWRLTGSLHLDPFNKFWRGDKKKTILPGA